MILYRCLTNTRDDAEHILSVVRRIATEQILPVIILASTNDKLTLTWTNCDDAYIALISISDLRPLESSTYGQFGANVTIEANEYTQEAVGLCWELLENVLIASPTPVWFSDKALYESSVARVAPIRVMSFTDGMRGHLLLPDEARPMFGPI